jgi:hypothetical protein
VQQTANRSIKSLVLAASAPSSSPTSATKSAQCGPHGLIFEQTARLNVVAHPPGPCFGTIGFIDTSGNPIGSPMPVSLGPNQATFVDSVAIRFTKPEWHAKVPAVLLLDFVVLFHREVSLGNPSPHLRPSSARREVAWWAKGERKTAAARLISDHGGDVLRVPLR